MKKLLTTIIIFAFVANISFAQNETKKFAFGVSAAISDFFAPDDGGFYKKNTVNYYPGPVHLSLAYNLIKPLNIATSFTLGDIEKLNKPITENAYWKWDAGIQLRALSFLLDDDHWFDPYLFANGGLLYLEKTNGPVVNGGLGINLWAGEYFAINVESGYNHGFDLDNYLETTFGIKIRIGESLDKDGDGISDNKDKCPDVPGLEIYNGCPDGDGIVDSKDDCPNVKGDAKFNGCPDSDGDGIVDSKDACPKVKGLEAFNGCPDTDGDGIADNKDDCSKVKGITSANGCPDSDGDGIADKNDDCPSVKGIALFNGCPDTDGDGIADKNDDCPNVKGIKALNGCPKIEEEKKKEIEDELRFSAKNIQFNTGKSTIKTISYKDIDNVITIMNKYPKVNFNIEGHTDNTGNYDSNKRLSQSRADAVKAYITEKGISASRLGAKGFGSDKPIASNNTSTGRQQNRRVEFVINQ